MAQRILERGQIETLASRSIPRIRLPDRAHLFERRAQRLGELAAQSPIGDYLRMLATIAAAQHAFLAGASVRMPEPAEIARAREHHMPPLQAAGHRRDPQWRDALPAIASAAAAAAGAPETLRTLCRRLRDAAPDWIEAQADALLRARDADIDAAAAPFIAAALQVHWVALSAAFSNDTVAALDVPGVCPLCGTLPVASIVAALAPHTGYRYLHCALCATEWHMVRVHCSHCGASGKDIAYRFLEKDGVNDGEDGPGAVRAETCEQCRAYRKIVYQEKDARVEPLADDVASSALDLLLAESGYHRLNANPLLWQPLGR